jgi:hypothetical protein
MAQAFATKILPHANQEENMENHASFPHPRQKPLEDKHTLLYEKKTRDMGVIGVTAPIFFALIIIPMVLFLSEGNYSPFPPFTMGIFCIIFVAIFAHNNLFIRRMPDKIYGTRDGLLVMRRGLKEKIPYANIRIKSEYGKKAVITAYGRNVVIIKILFLKPGKFGDRLQFYVNSIKQERDFLERLAACGGPPYVPVPPSPILARILYGLVLISCIICFWYITFR